MLHIIIQLLQSSNYAYCTVVVSPFFLLHLSCISSCQEKQRLSYGSFLLPFSEGETELGWLHTGDLVTTEGVGLRTNPSQLSLLVLYFRQDPGLCVASGGVLVMPFTFYICAQRTNPGYLFRKLTLPHFTCHLSSFLLYVLVHSGNKWSIFFFLPRASKITGSNHCFPLFAYKCGSIVINSCLVRKMTIYQAQSKCHVYPLSLLTLLASCTVLSLVTFFLFFDGNKWVSISQPLNLSLTSPGPL